LELRGQDGSTVAELTNFATFETSGAKALTVDVRKTLADNGLGNLDEQLIVLYASAAEGTDLIPMRLLYGMNYRIGRIGSNISNALNVHMAYGKSTRSYKWGPLHTRQGSTNYIVACHLSKVREANETASLHLKIFGAQGLVAERNCVSKNGQAHIFVVEDLLAERAGAGGDQVYWYTIESDNPNITAFELHKSAAGFVGADHSF
jgi:hypothetical protein